MTEGGAASGETLAPDLARLVGTLPAEVRRAGRDPGVVERLGEGPIGEALRRVCEAGFSAEEWGALLETRAVLSEIGDEFAGPAARAPGGGLGLVLFSLARSLEPDSCLALGPAAGLTGLHAGQALALNGRGTLRVFPESEGDTKLARMALRLLRDRTRVHPPGPRRDGGLLDRIENRLRGSGPPGLIVADGAPAVAGVARLMGQLPPGAVVVAVRSAGNTEEDGDALAELRARPEVAVSLSLGELEIVRTRAAGAEAGAERGAYRYPAAVDSRDGGPEGAPGSSAAGTAGGGVRAENLVWIFGSGRSGSTWLRSMMGELPGFHVWEEPMVGKLFGDFHARAQSGQRRSRNFIMGEPVRAAWIRAIRNFVLEVARGRFPRIGDDDFVVVKEPNGSGGAPLLMEALPESRMILLVRDPRDVVASVLDGAKKGSWLYERKDAGAAWKRQSMADTDPLRFAERRAEMYVEHVGAARRAFDAHPGSKALVRYEELREDAAGAMLRLYSELGLPAEEADLAEAVERHSWERIPEEEKGEGKFFRKGVSGGWREDLSPEVVEVVERVTAPILQEIYREGNETVGPPGL